MCHSITRPAPFCNHGTLNPVCKKTIAELYRVMSKVRRGAQKQKRIDTILQPKSLHETLRLTTLRKTCHEHAKHERPRDGTPSLPARSAGPCTTKLLCRPMPAPSYPGRALLAPRPRSNDLGLRSEASHMLVQARIDASLVLGGRSSLSCSLSSASPCSDSFSSSSDSSPHATSSDFTGRSNNFCNTAATARSPRMAGR